MPERDPVPVFLWWTALSSASFRGYGLAALIYFVTDADLEPLQLVLLGTALEVAVLVAEIPTGVVADTLSRKRSIVISHIIMGLAFVAVGLTTDFVLLLVTQLAWGIGYTFISGADVAWITDELDDPSRIDQVLARRERWRLLGGAVGLTAAGVLSWATDLATAMIVMGLIRLSLGLFVALLFTEHNFTPVVEHRFAEGGRRATSVPPCSHSSAKPNRSARSPAVFCSAQSPNGAPCRLRSPVPPGSSS